MSWHLFVLLELIGSSARVKAVLHLKGVSVYHYDRNECSLGRGTTFETGSKPIIVALDGPSGVGKTTLIDRLAEHLTACGKSSVRWTNADDEIFGPAIRGMAETGSTRVSLTLALAAARARLLETGTATDVVLCDRFITSSLVYQVYAGVPADYVLQVNRPFLSRVTTVILDIDAEGLEVRRNERGAQRRDWFKRSMSVSEELSLYRAAGDLLAKQGYPAIVIDAARSIEHTSTRLVRALSPIFGENRPA